MRPLSGRRPQRSYDRIIPPKCFWLSSLCYSELCICSKLSITTCHVCRHCCIKSSSVSKALLLQPPMSIHMLLRSLNAFSYWHSLHFYEIYKTPSYVDFRNHERRDPYFLCQFRWFDYTQCTCITLLLLLHQSTTEAQSILSHGRQSLRNCCQYQLRDYEEMQ
jgi:hypothetical protein